jgi:hypothetical protein
MRLPELHQGPDEGHGTEQVRQAAASAWFDEGMGESIKARPIHDGTPGWMCVQHDGADRRRYVDVVGTLLLRRILG